jgi:hypothetical protein
MGGYYSHLHNPTEKTYLNFLHRLQKEQLEPLNINSGNVKVYLPYLDYELIQLYTSFSFENRFNNINRKRLIVKLAIQCKIPEEIIFRRKYGFVDAMTIKGV